MPRPCRSANSCGSRSDRILGFVYCGPSPDTDADPETTGQILSIHVDPELTGHGIGRMLMGKATELMRAHGFAFATLWVVTDNHRARRFYENLDWRLDGSPAAGGARRRRGGRR